MPAAIALTEVPPAEYEALVPLLRLAEPSAPALRWSLENLSDTAYRAAAGGALVGAATMRWSDDPSELVELAVAPEQQGRGYGRAILEWLIAEGRRRGRRALEVGTGNASLGNIAFYQKCGFRMAHVRPDYFWYYREPVMENGIRVRDMLVFRYDLEPERSGGRSGSRRGARR